MVRPSIRQFHGVDVPAYEWAPATPRFGLIIVHGMTEHAACYDGVCQWVVQQGGVAVAVDHVGHGPSCRGQLGHLGPRGWDAIVARIASLTAAVTADRPNIPWLILGHSMGSFVAQDVLSRYSPRIKGFILTGATIESPWITGFARWLAGILSRLKGGNAPGTVFDRLIYGRFNRAFSPTRTPFDWLCRNPDVVDAYRSDPYCGFVPPISFYRALFSGIHQLFRSNALSKIPSVPILILSGAQDPVTRFGAGAHQLANRYRALGHEAVTVVIFSNMRHVILYERDNESVYRQLKVFIQTVTSRNA